jgi:hypothetical protein
MTGIDESNLFEDAQSDYVKIEHLDGRDVVVFPLTVHTASEDDKKAEKDYDYLVADVVVLSGETTDMIDAVPSVIGAMRLSSSPLMRNGERMLRKGPQKPFAGRINSRKGQKGNKAYGIESWGPEDAVRALANEQGRKYIAEHPVAEDAF